jgi:hypothetical protein
MSESSILLKPTIVATLATSGAMDDLQTLLYSLAIFNPTPPKVYLYCDSATSNAIKGFKYPGIIVVMPCLDKYAGMNRREMENQFGERFSNKWFDFMTEKIELLEWVFREESASTLKNGILFCDADICFFGPLPSIPANATLALSPHEIRLIDEQSFGRYNGGFLWMSDSVYPSLWKTHCEGSRFYEQSALEDLAKEANDTLYEFPRTQNYGWWRLWQGKQSTEKIKMEWTMNRKKFPNTSGILINGEPLGSVHTHFFEKNDKATIEYNQWVLEWLRRLGEIGGHAPAKKLYKWLKIT